MVPAPSCDDRSTMHGCTNESHARAYLTSKGLEECSGADNRVCDRVSGLKVSLKLQLGLLELEEWLLYTDGRQQHKVACPGRYCSIQAVLRCLHQSLMLKLSSREHSPHSYLQHPSFGMLPRAPLSSSMRPSATRAAHVWVAGREQAS